MCVSIVFGTDTVGDIVKQRLPGASRLSTKRSSRGLALPASPLAVAHTPIPYKKARKDEATGGLTPFDFNLVITAALNPDTPMQVRRLSAKPQHVIEPGAPPTESVIVLPELIKPGKLLKGEKSLCDIYYDEDVGCDTDYVDFFFY